MSTGMKVLALRAENFKRLSVVEIDPDNNFVVLTGENGAGKSSVIDALMAALGGGKVQPDRPVRSSATSAEVRVVLGRDGTPAYTVTREWRDGRASTLKIEDATGSRQVSPQSILNGFLSTLTFDPVAFCDPPGSKSADAVRKAQVEMLLKACPIGIDLEAHEQKRAEVYAARTEVNRQGRLAEGALAALPEPGPEAKREPVDESELWARIDATKQARQAWERADAEGRARGEEIESLGTQLGAVDVEVDAGIAQLRRQIEALEQSRVTRKAQIEQRIAAAETAMEDACAACTGDAPSEQPLLDELAELSATNSAINAARERARDKARARKALDDLLNRSKALTAEIEALDAAKTAALAAADFPVEGLSLARDGVVLRTKDGAEVPFSQASRAQQIQVSCLVAMRMHPDLRVAMVRDGSLLDRKSMAALRALAEAEDFQLWVERVEDDSPGAVVLEDGSVSAVLPVAEAVGA